jgi:hypothetical protein
VPWHTFPAMDMDAAGIRTVRAVVFTVLCVTLSAGAHVLLSGVPLPLAPLLAVGAVIFLLAFALADRERGYGRIAALLIPLELLADTVFTAGQHTCYGQGGGPVAGSLRSVGVELLCGGGTFGTPLARVAAEGREARSLSAGLPAGPWDTAPATTPFLLLAAHIAVGLVAAAWLRRGEAALAGLLRAASVAAFRPLRTAFAAWRGICAQGAAAPAAGAPCPVAPRTLPLLTHTVHRRGPPAPVLAA